MSLLDWINEHDCGVSPTAVQREDGAIEVRGQACNADGEWFVETNVVRTYAEARDVLGY